MYFFRLSNVLCTFLLYRDPQTDLALLRNDIVACRILSTKNILNDFPSPPTILFLVAFTNFSTLLLIKTLSKLRGRMWCFRPNLRASFSFSIVRTLELRLIRQSGAGLLCCFHKLVIFLPCFCAVSRAVCLNLWFNRVIETKYCSCWISTLFVLTNGK